MTYIVHADPGVLPSVMVDLFVDDNPHETLQGLKKMAMRGKYIEPRKKSKYLELIEKYSASRKAVVK